MKNSSKKSIHYVIGTSILLLCQLTALSQIPTPINRDSLFQIINNPSSNDTAKVWSLRKLTISYVDVFDYTNCEKTALKALYLAEKIKYKRGIALSNSLLGLVYTLTYNNKKALERCNASINMYAEINDTLNRNYYCAFDKISIMYVQTGLYDKAVEFELRTLRLAEYSRDTALYGDSYNNIANIYRTKQDYKKAIPYYDKAFEAYKKYTNDSLITNCTLYGLGDCYSHLDYNKSFSYFKRLESMGKYFNDARTLAFAYSGFGNLFKSHGKYKESIIIYRKSLVHKDIETYTEAYLNMGEIYLEFKKYDSSEYYLNKSLVISKANGLRKWIMMNYKNLYRLDSLKGDFKGAFLNQGLYNQYKDSIYNSESEQKIIATEMNLTFEKEKFIMKSKQDEISNTAEANRKRQREVIFGICLLLVLVVVVTITVYNGYVKQGKAYKLITYQKKLVDDKQKEILASIRYATRIQSSLLPTEWYVEKTLNKLNKI